MATALETGGHEEGFAKTQRTDKWWLGPAVTFVVFSAFIVYGTWAAFQNAHYWVGGEHAHGYGGYLSPFYSPPLFIDAEQAANTPGGAPLAHAWLGSWPKLLNHWKDGGIWPPFLPYSPGFLILIFPGFFRFTCYYYRKAYYRSFGLSPVACAVSGPKRVWRYWGESKLPFILQNAHRYALYFAVIFIFILSYDAFLSYFRDGVFGMGVGSFVLTMNAVLLACYTFGCHSWRHLIGGKMDCFTCDGAVKARHGIWKRVSWLNSHHIAFAWISLFWVGFSDVYIRLVSSGVIHDFNTWGGH